MYFDSAKNSAAVKRIIGIPGDEIQLTENLVLINGIEQKQTLKSKEDFSHIPKENGIGEVIAEENIFGENHLITFTPFLNPERNFEANVLKASEYFILGDHRDNSADSRYIGPNNRKGHMAIS